MWQAENKILIPTLSRYGDIINAFFLTVIKLSKDPNKLIKLKEDKFLIDAFNKEPLLSPKLLKINVSTTNQIKSTIADIIKLAPAILNSEYDIYIQQNNEVSKQNYNINSQVHPVPLTKIFKDYFYDKFFGVAWIWRDLVGKEYTRSMFKEDFKTENGLYVCSYCDTDSISNNRNSWIEHFLPKSKFPYVSCNPYNLIPSCTSCNVSGTGKGEDVKNPITNQYTSQIGDKIEFEFTSGKIIIKECPDLGTENYIKLLNLRKRYQEKGVSVSALSILKINYNLFQKIAHLGVFDEAIFLDYIQDIGRKSGFYFVQKNLFKDIDQIK